MSRDVPAPVHPDDRGAEEDERHETGPGRRGLIVEKGEDRHEHRADEAEPRDDLRRPVERERDSDSCDSGGQSQGYERRHQLVPGCGEEQRRVPAGDSGAGSGNRHWSVPWRACAKTPAAKTSADAIAPSSTRSIGPIQPLLAASAKKKTTPSSVTTPPASASPRAPSRSAPSSLGSNTSRLKKDGFRGFGCAGGCRAGAGRVTLTGVAEG
jgi:hypothetical protein